MKKSCLIFAAAFLLFSCQKEDGLLPETTSGFSVSEAREFYESRPWGQAFSRSGDEEVLTLWPGAMNPDWNTGTKRSNRAYEHVYAPIPDGYRFAIKRGETFTKASQLLSIVKRRSDGAMRADLVTLLPTEEYRETYGEEVAKQFLYFDDYFDYSGVVIYHTLDELAFIGVGLYECGELTAYYSYADAADYAAIETAVDFYLDGASVWRGRTAVSRYYDLDGGWIDEINVVGRPPSDISQWDNRNRYNYDPIYEGGGYSGEDVGGPLGGGGGGGSNSTTPKPTVRVENGRCLIGSIAVAIQVKFNVSAATAISRAEAAAQAAGIPITPTNGGITYLEAKVEQAMTALGFNIVTLPSPVMSNWLTSHFANGGFGIGDFSGNPGHAVFLTGFDAGTFNYYDPVLGGNYTGNPNGILLYFH